MPCGIPSRPAAALAAAGLVVVFADLPARITAAVVMPGAAALAEDARRDRDRDANAAYIQFNNRLAAGLIDGHDTLPAAAALLASTRPPTPAAAEVFEARHPGLTPTARAAAALVELVGQRLYHEPDRRRVVLARLLAEYRAAFGECPPALLAADAASAGVCRPTPPT